MQFEDIGRGRELAARERVTRNFTTAGEAKIAKNVALRAVEAEILVSTSTVSVLIVGPK